jgi:hypothetical protein
MIVMGEVVLGSAVSQAWGMLSQRLARTLYNSSSPSYRRTAAARSRVRAAAGNRRGHGRMHSTGEGGEPQGSRKGRPRNPLEGRGEQAHESAERRHAQDLEPARVMLTVINRIAALASQLAKEDPA